MSKKKKKDLNEFDKSQIFMAWAVGQSISEIVQILVYSCSAVVSCIPGREKLPTADKLQVVL